MFWKIALTIITNILAVLGYLFLYWSDKQKLKKYKIWLLTGLILTTATIWGNFVREIEVETSNRRLTELLEPFTDRARLEYPGWSDQEALQKLASEISKMQPKLVFWDHTEPLRDSISNLFHTIYVFRSEPATGLRDVQVRIRFDRAFVTITERKSGAFVEEQGTRITIDPDYTGFHYITGYLKEGNDINIEVVSEEALKIVSKILLPQ
jgi:hypothetical protein